MSWTWQYRTSDGEIVAHSPGSQEFPTQADAETWVGETWQELLASGVDAVFLVEDDHQVYGPMSLHPSQ